MCIECSDGPINNIDTGGKTHTQYANIWADPNAGFGFETDAQGNAVVFINAGNVYLHKTMTVKQLRDFGRKLQWLANMAASGYDWERHG